MEGIDRRTAYSAKQILSKRLGFVVRAEKRIILTSVNEEKGSAEGMEGYIFMKET